MAVKRAYWSKAAQAEQKIHEICEPFDYALGGLYALITVYDMEFLKSIETDIDVFLPLELFITGEPGEICSRFAAYGLPICSQSKDGKTEIPKTIDVDGIKVDIGGRYSKDVKIRRIKSRRVLAPEEIVFGKLVRAAGGRGRASKDMRELRIIFDNYRDKIDVNYIIEKAEKRLKRSALYLEMMNILEKLMS